MQSTNFMSEIPNKTRHLIFTSTNDVEQALQPLKEYGITHFFYLKYFYDGSFIELSNSGNVMEYFFTHIDPISFKKHIQHYLNIKDKIHLSADVDPIQPIALAIRDKFGLCSPFLLIETSNHCKEIFSFCSAHQNQLLNFYFNNLHLLQQFTVLFKKKMRSLINRATKVRIQLDCSFLNESNHIYIPSTFLKITPKQMECLFHLLRGKSRTEIATIVNRSPRTIDTHTEALKLTFNCDKKSELIEKALDGGYFRYTALSTNNAAFT